ncbi:MAG: dihydrolipoamide acetyltransferase family protein, partial [Candidatus Bathyarchaeia archaeon]
MVTEVIMPKMGDTMEKGKIVKWLKKDGEKIERGEPLLEIETEKTTIEVESRGSGTLKILVPEGEERPINTLIGYILKEGEALPEKATPKPPSVIAEVAREQTAESVKVGKLEAEVAARIKASPLAKKIAEEKGVDLTKVIGTGPGGRITQEDVLNYISSKPAVESAEVPAAEFQIIPMSSMRRAIARKMTESKTHVPHFYVSTQVDMTEAVKLRENLIPSVEAKSGVRLSFTHLLIKAVAMALQEFPQVNSTFEAENIKQWKDINIGIAVNLEDGLIVPVLRRANKLNIFEIASQADKLVEKAKAKKLREDEFSG